MSIASLESFWNPLTCFAICAMVYVVGEFFSHLTKGNISSLMFASFLFLIGFWLDVFPADITTKPGIAAAMSNFGVALLITNLGTMINLETICKEWKTALIALLGLGGILIAAFTFGTWLFGREYALMAAPPLSGGTIAGILVQPSYIVHNLRVRRLHSQACLEIGHGLIPVSCVPLGKACVNQHLVHV